MTEHPHKYMVSHVAFVPDAQNFPAMFFIRWACEEEDCEVEVLEVVEARQA